MGCGCSAAQQGAAYKPAGKRVGDYPGDPLGILVLSAANLRHADWVPGGGQSDPFVLCRVGPLGSTWEAKPKETETQSHTEWFNVNPVWQHAFCWTLPKGAKLDAYELHIKVFDRDVFTECDPLGELQIPLAAMAAHENEAREYPLPTQGTVSVMMGDRVEKALMEELASAIEEAKSGNWYDRAQKALNKIGHYFRAPVATPYYYFNMLQMAMTWSMSLKGANDPSSEWFLARSRDHSTGADTFRWVGPEIEDCITLSGHAEVSEQLASLGQRLGTNDRNGQVYKPNFLGFQLLNRRVWPETPWHTIGLSCPQEFHAKIRPLLAKLLVGPGQFWGKNRLQEMARSFFAGRSTIAVNRDLRVWSTQVLHQVMFGLELSEVEGAEFMAMQAKILVLAGAPEQAMDLKPLQDVLKFKETMAAKAQWIERYKFLLRQQLPEDTKGFSPAELTWFASAAMDALVFAGGQSVPSVLAWAIALPFSRWGKDNLPSDFSLDDVSLLPSYLWEVVRFFSPVSGFTIAERSYGTAPERHVFFNLQMASRDPRVWGPDAMKFKIRSIEEYRANSVSFAEPASLPTMASPNSRACPARGLAFGMTLAFMTELARSAAEVVDTERAVEKVWKPQAAEPDSSGYLKGLAPDDISITLYGTTSFRLTKDSSLPLPPTRLTGAELLDKLSEEEKALIRKQVRVDNKFDKTNANTRLMLAVVEALIVPGSVGPATLVRPPTRPTNFSPGDIWNGPIPGLRLLLNNEDLANPRLAAVQKVFKMIAIDAEGSLPNDESLDKLVWFDSDLQAVVSVDATFARYLPQQFNTWPEMGSDEGLAALCVSGVGAWYLTPVRSAAESGHPVPDGAKFEVNLEYMGKYETRASWMRYGHTAYLGAARDDTSRMPRDVLGIYSCHHKKLFQPNDPQWAQAKAGFRCSLTTSITLKEHLSYSHWIVGEGLQSAVRETCDVDHPLRRLLKQFYFNTSKINEMAKDTLLPEMQFGHRVFGFSWAGWVSYFTDVFTSWRWVPFPEQIRRKQLPGDFVADWAVGQDGIKLWKIFEKYCRDYLRIFYPTDAKLLADASVVSFWAHFDTYLKWQLPALTLDNLTALLADLLWWVTGGHEFVGAIAEYLTSLDGLFSKVIEGRTGPDVQTLAQALILISLTGIKQPGLMNDWTHLFQVASWPNKRREAVLRVVRQFQVDLEQCADEMDAANYQRARRGERKFVAFNPRILETSVSI